MVKAGEEDTIRECDANIAINYRMVKKHKQDGLIYPLHHEEEMNKSLDRRSYLMSRELVK